MSAFAMFMVAIEAHSIARIEASAQQAFDAGETEDANPYGASSTAARIWMLHYDECKRAAVRRSAREAKQ